MLPPIDNTERRRAGSTPAHVAANTEFQGVDIGRSDVLLWIMA
jgi:hypothetical protein